MYQGEQLDKKRIGGGGEKAGYDYPTPPLLIILLIAD